MSDDLVKRLRKHAHWGMMVEAANRIDQLAATNEELEAQLVDGAAKTLDAANEYITTQYGISALGNPIDRSRILAKIKGEQP